MTRSRYGKGEKGFSGRIFFVGDFFGVKVQGGGYVIFARMAV